ncbi:cell wall synthesis protein CwsA [Mycolicibacterium brumae]|uniref:Cell wall synthesis protein CwsA n=1 Tax=Mycolicibacterium brumae TaxID=85968 RepID=A0A2G5P5K9_9MYCO|nr:cell wall synthesis protein CwsA [Mycolicibacterium brumae]MCV7192204.1 cell wall synthesis protein CwsA [Mycolicibacterium brumae]PIB73575.1 cell wall synthesis protein CwsA [Mycolicibacterium brumae]RWA21261.1 hypothetical protein MBRU_15060 [Mycolicibacterium brumae DSM 44177]UWW07029.1 cell wall synthesis protein CwsA [Mycolicibacterium brumae]
MTTTEERLTPGKRLTQGLAHTATGPLDVGRGIVGLGVATARAAASNAQVRYERAQVRRQLESAQQTIADEFSAAQEVVAGIPQALADARKSGRARKIGLITGIGLATAVGGAVAFSIIRRSMQPEPSPLPPSVEVDAPL